jgi:hypothetical protein
MVINSAVPFLFSSIKVDSSGVQVAREGILEPAGQFKNKIRRRITHGTNSFEEKNSWHF